MTAIAILDFADYEHGTQSRRKDFCMELYDALSHAGFVKITNHGIPEDAIEQVFSWSRRFFDLSVLQKMKAAHSSQPNPHRGWSFVGQEKLSAIQQQGKAVLDVKESFDQGPCDDELYPNVWCEESDLPGFRAFMQEFYERCHDLHLRLLAAIAQSMALPSSFLANQCGQNSSELRLNHYPATNCRNLMNGSTRISSHTDFGTITLLFQDGVGGLEIEDQAEEDYFVPVAAGGKSELILNVGDCLQRWTNDRLRSANHRVTLPLDLKCSPDGQVADRYSVAYFGKPDRHVLVRSLPELATDEPLKYTESKTAWQFNQSRLLQTY